MNNQFFLKQSPRGIFFLLVLVPCSIQLILINLIEFIANEILYYLTFLFFAMMYLPYFYWLNLTVNFLYNMPNNHLKLKFINFRVSLLINIITLFNFTFFVAYNFRYVFFGGQPNFNIIYFMLSIQFIGIISFIYNAYFINKLIVTLELKRKVELIDYIGNFPLLSFPPVAIWFIQNKIKKFRDKV
jgi:hypothetical protein